MYKLKVVHAYVPTSSHDDVVVKQFYEDIELAMRKVKTQNYIL